MQPLDGHPTAHVVRIRDDYETVACRSFTTGAGQGGEEAHRGGVVEVGDDVRVAHRRAEGHHRREERADAREVDDAGDVDDFRGGDEAHREETLVNGEVAATMLMRRRRRDAEVDQERCWWF
jgi:hypothetical protein